MKNIQQYLVLAVSIIALMASGCNRSKEPQQRFDVASDVTCSFHEHTFNVAYKLIGTTDAIEVTAYADAEWVTAVDATRKGNISISVASNEGEERSTTLHIHAEGMPDAKVTIRQMGTPPEIATHTLIYYFFGTSLSRYFTYNLEDASTAISNGALGYNNRVMFVRQTNQSEGYIGELCYNPADGSCIEQHLCDIIIDATRPMSDNISEMIATIADLAPAQRYGMVLAGHGQGWVTREALEDSASIFSVGGSMWTPAYGAEITRAFGEKNVRVDVCEIADGIAASGVEFDYLLFDACFMSNIESLYDLRDSANYIIASPCEIMGRGFPYHRTLPYLFAEDGAQSDLIGAAESYYQYYRDEYNGTARCGSVAVIDCSELEALADATRQLVSAANKEVDNSKLQFYEGHNIHTFFDFGQWATMVTDNSTALANFQTQLNNTVIAKYTLPSFYSALGNSGTYSIDESVYSGVTTSATSLTYPDYWTMTSWYKAVWE